eukprot:SM001000S09166  [mRNA]  locus=s1000:1513:2163:- [translate_table: standard]
MLAGTALRTCICWVRGALEDLGPCTELVRANPATSNGGGGGGGGGGLSAVFVPKHFDARPLRCNGCGAGAWADPPVLLDEAVVLVALVPGGRHEFRKAKYRCSACGLLQKQGPADFLQPAAFTPSLPSTSSASGMRCHVPTR